MPLDGVSSRCLAAELNQLLAGARVDRIYQPDRADILFVLRGDSKNHRLLVSANPSAPRLHLSDEDRENPGTPPMFCMLLRKHLLGARLTAVETPGYERIFIFHFSVIDELGDTVGKRLVAEIMGRHSNIILLNEEGRIHDAIVHVDESVSRVREIMPARVYQLPPDQQKTAPPDLLTRSGPDLPWRAPALANKTVDKALLASIQGFSPQLCQEVVLRAGLEKVAAAHERITDVRGLGLMLGCEFRDADGRPDGAAASAAQQEAARRGLLLLTCGAWGQVVRFIPALVVDDQLVDEALSVWEEAVAAVS